MASTPETGILVIADLTGYTAYLAGSEIEHAPAIAGDLLETIVAAPQGGSLWTPGHRHRRHSETRLTSEPLQGLLRQ